MQRRGNRYRRRKTRRSCAWRCGQFFRGCSGCSSYADSCAILPVFLIASRFMASARFFCSHNALICQYTFSKSKEFYFILASKQKELRSFHFPNPKENLSYSIAKSKELSHSMDSETMAYWDLDPIFCSHKPSR